MKKKLTDEKITDEFKPIYMRRYSNGQLVDIGPRATEIRDTLCSMGIEYEIDYEPITWENGDIGKQMRYGKRILKKERGVKLWMKRLIRNIKIFGKK